MYMYSELLGLINVVLSLQQKINGGLHVHVYASINQHSFISLF